MTLRTFGTPVWRRAPEDQRASGRLSFVLFVGLAFGVGGVPGIVKAGTGGEFQVKVEGGTLWGEKVGAGPPIVVIHGGPGLDSVYLEEPLRGLGKDRTLIFYDQRGCGRSVDNSVPISLPVYVDDLEAIRQSLGVEKMALLAHSFGGLLALRYAARFPQHVASVVLVSSMGPTSATFEREEKILQTRIMEYFQTHPTPSTFLNPDDALRARFLAIQPLYFHDPAKMHRLHLGATTALTYQALTTLGEYDLRNDLKRLRVPVLLAYGRHDVWGRATVDELRHTFPQAKVVWFEQSGHWPFLEEPDRFIEVIHAFVSQR